MKISQVSVAALAIGLAAPAWSQTAGAPVPTNNGGIEEIVVTAQKRAENVQNVPIAISAFTANALQERQVTSVAQLSNIAPNVTLDAGTPFSGSSQVLSAYIRGIGANDFAFNIDPGVGVYLDGVYLARSVGANQDLPDVERIEVLKGPQGTLFGRNTIGGAISIVTHDPGKEFAFRGDVTTGSYRLIQTRGVFDIPITDGLGTSFAFSVKNRNGYLQRVPYPGASNFVEDPVTSMKAAGYNNIGYGTEGGDNSYSLRGKVKWANGGKFRATFSADFTNVDTSQIANKVIKTFPAVFAGTYNCAIAASSTGCGGGPPAFAFIPNRGGQTSILDLASIYGVNVDGNPLNDRLPYDDRFVTNNIDTSYANGNNFNKLRAGGASAILEYDLSDAMTVKSISAWRELHWKVGQDLDGSPLDFLHTSFAMNQVQYSEEVQLLGHALDHKLNYVLGGYYFHEHGDLHDYVTFADGLLQVDGPNNLSTQNYAFFGQLDYRFSQLFGITVGGRYTHEDKKFEGFQSDANGLNYKIAYELNQLGIVPNPCTSLSPISPACQASLGFPDPNNPLRYYPPGEQHKTFNNFSPKVAVELHPSERILAYASWSRGYKTGGWTTRLSNPLPTAPNFGPEKAETFEIGVKSQLFDRHLQLNGAVFTTDYKGIQLNFQQGVSPVIQNAGDATIRGFELEAVIAPVRAFTLTGSVGYLDAHYRSVLGPAQVAPTPGVFGDAGVIPGATLPKTPDWKFNVSPRFEQELNGHGTLILIGDYTYTARLKNDTEGYFLIQRPATNIVNATLTYREPKDRWDLSVGGTNITDERYLVTGQAQLAGGQAYGTYSRPAEWFARLGVRL